MREEYGESMKYHSNAVSDILEELGSVEHGLHETEARKRLAEFGLNELTHTRELSPVKILLSSLTVLSCIYSWQQLSFR